ncbi:MAG: recombination protein RecR [Alphaproteobacteria bacterium]|nr:recombination protein RecR [Alphaproteobacteria bacterium]
MAGPEIERMVQLLARLPGLGPRSARRAALFLIKRRDSLLEPLGRAIADTLDRVRACSVCGNLDSADPCAICADARRDETMLCVVEDVVSLWALERSGAFRGRYHVLGGVLSALEGVGPEDLGIPGLVQRVAAGEVREVILALSATVDGQTTAHYIVDRLAGASLRLTGLAHGVPVGGELDYLDEGTISAALAARRPM